MDEWLWPGMGQAGGGMSSQRALLVYLGIGESNMVGQGSTADAPPAGYPPIDGSLQFFDQSYNVHHPAGAQQQMGLSPQLNPPLDSAGGYGWAQFALNAYRPEAYIDGRQQRFVAAGKNGSLSTQWAFDTSVATLCGAAIKQLEEALAADVGTQWAGLFIDQGYNDAFALGAAGWAARWQAIVDGLFAHFGKTVPIWFRRMQTDLPTGMDPAQLALLIAEQDSWASTSPVRRPCVSPNGMSPDTLHLSTAGCIAYGEGTVLAAMQAYPPAIASAVAYAPVKTSPLAAGAVAWWRIEDASPSSWVDSIGGYALTQATGAKQPSLVADAGFGRPGLLFNGAASNSMRFPAAFAALLSGLQTYTLFRCCRPTSNAVNMNWCVSRVAAPRYELAFGTLANWQRESNYRTIADVPQIQQGPLDIIVQGEPQVLANAWDGAASAQGRQYQNGMWSQISDPHGPAHSLATLDEGAIGCFTFTGNEAFHFTGYYGDVALFLGVLTPAQVRAVSLYLLDRAP